MIFRIKIWLHDPLISKPKYLHSLQAWPYHVGQALQKSKSDPEPDCFYPVTD